MENIETITISFFAFSSLVLIIYIISKYHYLLKKVLAEKGVMESKIKINYSEIGCIVIGIALGLGIASIVTVIELSEDTSDLLIWSAILIGGGLGLLGAHFIRQKTQRGEQG
jgi:hypothetical protein